MGEDRAALALSMRPQNPLESMAPSALASARFHTTQQVREQSERLLSRGIPCWQLRPWHPHEARAGGVGVNG